MVALLLKKAGSPYISVKKSKTNADGEEPDLTDERGAESGPKKDAIEEADHLPSVKKE